MSFISLSSFALGCTFLFPSTFLRIELCPTKNAAFGPIPSEAHFFIVFEIGRGLVPSFPTKTVRSEEHTSELQSRFDLVCRLLLEKKKLMSIMLRSVNVTT